MHWVGLRASTRVAAGRTIPLRGESERSGRGGTFVLLTACGGSFHAMPLRLWRASFEDHALRGLKVVRHGEPDGRGRRLRGAFRPHASPMTGHDGVHGGETESEAFVVLGAVQAPKDDE